MQMLLIVFRDSLEDDLRRLLDQLGVKGFTEAPRLIGRGESGTALNSFDWPGTNAMIFTALEDTQARAVLEGLKRFHAELGQHRHGAKVPIRVFTLPCEQIL
jgi:hypothetical protein